MYTYVEKRARVKRPSETRRSKTKVAPEYVALADLSFIQTQ